MKKLAFLLMFVGVLLLTSAIPATAQDTMWVTFTVRAVNKELSDPEGFMTYDMQDLLFNRTDWETKKRAELTKDGRTLPADYFAPVYEKADELKAKVEKEAPNKQWKQPSYTDAAVEAFVKQQYAARLKGTQILKIGLSYTTWKVYKNSIGIPTNQYKRGLVLVKVPNKPYCQVQEFVVKKEYMGGGSFSEMKMDGGVGGVGSFTSCQ